jgi:hypothetical protein
MSGTKKLTQGQVSAFRLRSHHLAHLLPADRLVDAVRDSGGIQAQVMTAARLSLRARTRDLTPDMVETALEVDRTLVKVCRLRLGPGRVPYEDHPALVRGCGPHP